MAEGDASNSKETTPLRGVGKWGTPELPDFSNPGNWNDDCCKYKVFINHFRERGTWGFAIFRTVYTPESDQQFVSALAKIEGHIRLGLSKEPVVPDDRHPAERLLLVDIIMSHFRNTIFEDQALLNGATAEELRPLFQLWLAEIERSSNPFPCYGYSNFIIIDEESLQAIMAAPDTIAKGRRTMSPEAIVRIAGARSRPVATEGTLGLWEEYHNATDDHY